MLTTSVRIDKAHTLKLLRGEAVTIKVPPNAQAIRLQVEAPDGDRNYLAELVDVFFNGRKAR
jgi:hypothetical protein